MQSYDPIWDQIYQAGGQLNRYPFSSVVTYLYRNAPRDRPRSEVRILEIGCGAGNNLWFAAREGFDVTGIDGSATVIDFANSRFAEDGLRGTFLVGDFTKLPFDAGSFDIVLERGAISSAPRSGARKAIEEAARVLRPDGQFYGEIYSNRSTTRGRRGPDGLLLDTEGPLGGNGQMAFYGRDGIEALFDGLFDISGLMHVESMEYMSSPREIYAYWAVAARKRPA